MSSDKYGPSYLCTHVRYAKNGKFITCLLSLEEIKNNSTGESLFGILESIFNHSKHILLQKNLIGTSTDGGSNMYSSVNKGLTNRIQNKYPQVVRTKDLCRLFNTICGYALAKFPAEPI